MKNLFIILAMLTGLAAFAATAQAADLPLQVAPRNFEIGTFYHGDVLTVTGEVPEGSDVVLRFEGKGTELHMKKKGKALGLLWMNLGSLSFENAPNIFLVSSSKPLEQMPGKAAALGLQGLKQVVEVQPAGVDDESMLAELVHLKKTEGLYDERTGEISLGAAQDGIAPFQASMRLPSRLTPGDYTVRAFALKDGAIAAQAEGPVHVQLVALPAFISNLAFGHGALFGVLATVAAILGGLAIGFIFQGSSKGAH